MRLKPGTFNAKKARRRVYLIRKKRLGLLKGEELKEYRRLRGESMDRLEVLRKSSLQMVEQ